MKSPRVTVLYHYFHPDDVISARHFGDFCSYLAERGWDVEVRPSNRSCHNAKVSYPRCENWRGMKIRRVWRPPLRQSSKIGRIVNALWMIAAWSVVGLRQEAKRPTVLILGTDPILSVLVAAFVRRFRPKVRIAHWCFDLYPEIAFVEGMLKEDGLAARILNRLLRKAYASCDLVADLGTCMRERLARYQQPGRKLTLVPWALAEPAQVNKPNPRVRQDLFGASRLGLLYSGNLGRGHEYQPFLDLARELRPDGVHVCFGARGAGMEGLKKALLPEDRNISVAGFAPESELAARLEAADIHLASQRPEWNGLLVPSKFFGSLAVGRPVLFAGPENSALAGWIREHDVGWVLNPVTQSKVIEELRGLTSSPERLRELQHHCFHVYHAHFSKDKVMGQWERALEELAGIHMPRPAAGNSHSRIRGEYQAR